MSDPTYTPPKIWSFDAANGGKFANINRPTAPRCNRLQVTLQVHTLSTTHIQLILATVINLAAVLWISIQTQKFLL